MKIGRKSSLHASQTSKVIDHIYRGGYIRRLQLYPYVKRVFNELQIKYRLALISDAQSCYALPEIQAVGLENYFESIVISSRYGFRKPDPRLFQKTLDNMQLASSEVILVGNDMFRDIYGAQALGIKTIYIDSNQGAKSDKDLTQDYRIQQVAVLLQRFTPLAS